MINSILDAILSIRLKKKIARGAELTPLEVVKIASSPRLSKIMEARGAELTVRLPSFIKIVGLEDLVVAGSARVHCQANLVITTGGKLFINSPDMKGGRLTSLQIDRHALSLQGLKPAPAATLACRDGCAKCQP